MTKFSYTTKDRAGRTIKGDVEAQDKKQALDVLRGKGLLVLKLEKARQSLSMLDIFKRKSVSTEDMVILFRQLATMIESGIPVVTALDIVLEQLDNPVLHKAITEVRADVNTGSSISDAMAKHPGIFNALFINMVHAGESSGTLDVILDRVATYIEKSSSLQRKIQSALMYPAVVSCLALIITSVLILKVLPVFKEVFASFGAQLPRPTRILLAISDFTRQYFLLIVIAIIGAILAFRWYARTPGGRYLLDKYKLRAPIFGQLLTKVSISKFSRTLSTLVKSGVPILASLEIVAKTSGNRAIEESVKMVRDRVRDGETIATPLEKSGMFPSMVTRMVSVGEKTGQLEKMLGKIADFYDSQVDTAVEGLTSMIEPLIIAFLGLIIGSIVLCMFLPIFKISTIINV